MKNIQMDIEGKKLIITVDLSQEHERSSSGKSITIASTEGNISVSEYEDIKVGINIYRPVPKGGW